MKRTGIDKFTFTTSDVSGSRPNNSYIKLVLGSQTAKVSSWAVHTQTIISAKAILMNDDFENEDYEVRQLALVDSKAVLNKGQRHHVAAEKSEVTVGAVRMALDEAYKLLLEVRYDKGTDITAVYKEVPVRLYQTREVTVMQEFELATLGDAKYV